MQIFIGKIIKGEVEFQANDAFVWLLLYVVFILLLTDNFAVGINTIGIQKVLILLKVFAYAA